MMEANALQTTYIMLDALTAMGKFQKVVWWANNMHKEKVGLPNEWGTLNWFEPLWIYC
jgi:hypothetical protein